MRHRVDGRKLGRTSAHRKAMFSNMLVSLVLCDRIETTLPKAKELRRFADRLITLGKQKTLHARRRAASIIRNRHAVSKVFSELATRFEARKGGYTRIYRLGNRHGDSAPMAIIEYLPSARAEAQEEKSSHKKPKAKRAKAEAKPEKYAQAREQKAEKLDRKARKAAASKDRASRKTVRTQVGKKQSGRSE